MASSSSSSVQQKHQVFLSFRGEDTRNNFISHLSAELKRKRIDTFTDKQLDRGEKIHLALLRAIEQSTISVIVLSKNYASSSWCLDELSKILECKDINGQIVVPIFYYVNPSDIRNLKGIFAEAFAKHEERFKYSINKLKKWKAALVEVANLSGWPYERHRPEADFIRDVVEDIGVKLKKLPSSVVEGPVINKKQVDCSACCRALLLPPGAQSLCCPLCYTVTFVADHRSTPPPKPADFIRVIVDIAVSLWESIDDLPVVYPSGTVDTSTCHTQLLPPPGARSIAFCDAVTSVADHRSTPPPRRCYGRKRALICAVSYKHTQHELKGSVNNAKGMKYLLLNRFKFPKSSVLMLSEEEIDPYRRPTKRNIRTALHWLVQGCQPGDSLVFHFSGHGSQQRNYTGDEVDDYYETLSPTDFETQGMILDVEINGIIIRPLPHGVTLHAIIDVCHSGTVLDLPYLCRMDRNGRYAWEDHRRRSGIWNGTKGGEVISFSCCDDDQTSDDTLALSNTATGVITSSFIQAIEGGHGTTYGNMLNAMRSIIRNTGSMSGDGRLVTSLMTLLLVGGSGLGQEPQLSANALFNVNSKAFSL